MESEFNYTGRNFSGHVPAADSLSKKHDFYNAAAFPAVSGLTSVQAKQNAIQKKDGNASMPAQLSSGFSNFFMKIISGNNSNDDVETPDVSELSFEKLVKTAELLGVDPVRLIEHLNQENIFSNEERNNFLDTYFNHPKTKHGNRPLSQLGLVPTVLIENLEGSEYQKLQTIFERLNAYNFTYTGISNSAFDGFVMHSGDCYTLSGMFMAAAEAAGIEGVERVTNGYPTLVQKHSIHGRHTKGNVQEKFCWYFVGHHWCTYKGQTYDLLFMTKHLPVTRQRVGIKQYKGITYTVFEHHWSFIEKDEAYEKLHIQLASGELGIVRTGGEKGIRYFIDGNLG